MTMVTRILLGAALATPTAALPQPQPNPIAALAAKIRSPEISGRSVTFRFLAPKATVVTLNGSWISAVDLRTTKDDGGVWSTTATRTPQMGGAETLRAGVGPLGSFGYIGVFSTGRNPD